MRRLRRAALLLWAAGLLVAAARGASVAVPYLPTPPEVVRAMLEVARVGPDDTVMDLGSGDGRIVIAAARDFGARAVGIERDEALVERSRAAAESVGVADRATFRRADLYAADLRGVSVLTMYLLPSVNLGLRMRILEQMAPGARVVSHAYDMGDWRPDARLEVGAAKVFLWVVPARMDGLWRLTIPGGAGEAPRTASFAVEQHFQQLSVRVAEGPDAGVPLAATLEGAQLTLALPAVVGGGTLRGRVLDDLVSGTIAGRFASLRRVGPVLRRTARLAVPGL